MFSTLRYKKPDFQALRYHSAPKKKKTVGSLDEIDPEMRAAWDKLGIPIGEQVRDASHQISASLLVYTSSQHAFCAAVSSACMLQ